MPSFCGSVSAPRPASSRASSPEANFATYHVITRISVAATMFGTATRNFCSISVAGREIASICSASRAAISDGTKTKMKTISANHARASPCRSESWIVPAELVRAGGGEDARQPSRASTLASSQPTKPMMAAPTMFGTIASSLASISCTGSSRPCSSKAERMVGDEEQDHQPEEDVGDGLAHRLHPGLLTTACRGRGRLEERILFTTARMHGREQPGDQREDGAGDEATADSR